MNCPSCQTPLPPGARFCGVCGHQLQSAPAAAPPARPGMPRPGSQPAAPGGARGSEPVLRPPPAARPLGLRKKPEGDPFVGQVLNNRFKIESKLGEGGFGAVYRGTQVQTGRKVALKLLHPEMTRDDNLVARFRREGLVLCNLQDPHTITTYDFDSTPDGTLYIAMELLEGKSLHAVFHSEAPIEWKRVLKILAQMCSSLGEAHRQGIVHRDLKPENIYLENRGGDPEFVKILDFGIAKVMRGDNSVDPQAPQLTATGQTLGTLEYMSPEQLMGKQLDGRSDVYALGVLGYELLTGRLPFPDAKGPAALITAQLKQTPKPPSTVQGAIPAGVDRLIGKMLEKDKNQRFPDVGALAAAAQECIATGHWGEPAAPAAPPAPLPAVAQPKPAPSDLHGQPTAPSHRAMPGQGPMGQGPMGQGPMGQGPMGQMPHQGPMGQGPMGQGPMGQMPHQGPMGQGPMGQGPMGQGPMGPAPYPYPPTASVTTPRSRRTMWMVIVAAVIAIGAGVGLALAL
ncbi:MAG: protein kinase [Myxococcales bacterium]|nr:protein kinase [Myxococcales bacterium]